MLQLGAMHLRDLCVPTLNSVQANPQSSASFEDAEACNFY